VCPFTLPKRKVDLKNYLRKVMVMTDIFYIETLFPMRFSFALQLVKEKTKISGYMKNGFSPKIGHNDVASTHNIPKKVHCCLPHPRLFSLTL